MKKITKEDLDGVDFGKDDGKDFIKVGMSTCGIAAGADVIYAHLVDEAKKRNIEIAIKKCGCVGACSVEPLVEVRVSGLPKVLYGRVTKEAAVSILEKHVRNKKLVQDFIYEIL